MDWTEKYRPAHLQDLIGNTQVLQQMVLWARSWTTSNKPLLLYGKPGTGKTSSAHALAHDMGWDIVEMNASDQRTKSALEKIAGSSAVTASVTGSQRKLILLDEVDNLYGTADRGGAKALLDIVKIAAQPIILIANNLQDVPADLRSRCEPLQFRSVQARSIVPRLKYICSAERTSCTDTALRQVAERSGGDVRAAITILYAAAIGRDRLDEMNIYSTRKDDRSTIFDLVNAVFSGRRAEDLMKLAMDSGETPDTIEQWLEGSIRHLPDRDAMFYAYRFLARADRYLGLTFRRQYYTLWRYAQAIALIGMRGAAKGRGLHVRISPPMRWQHLGTSKRQRAVRIALLNKLASTIHIPQQILHQEFFSTLTLLVDNNPEKYIQEFELDVDELNLFLHDSNRASSIMKRISDTTMRNQPVRPDSSPTRREKQGAKKQKTLF